MHLLRALLLVFLWLPGAGAQEAPIATMQTGWPNTLPPWGHTFFTADLDADGVTEVIFSNLAAPWLHAYDIDGTLRSDWLHDSAGGLFVGGHSNVAFTGDIDGDPGDEIVVVNFTEAGWVWAFESDGTLKPGWPVSVGDGGDYIGRIALEDLTGDGVYEIVVLDQWTFSQGRVWVYDGHGEVVPGWPQQVEGLAAGLAIGDVEFDGDLEIVVTTGHPVDPEIGPNPLYVFEHDGTLREGWPKTMDEDPGTLLNVVLADVDNDFRCELVGTTVGAFYAVNLDGELVTAPLYDPSAGARLAVGDLEGDGDLEIVIPWNGITVIDPQEGTIAEVSPSPEYYRYRSVVIADLDGDGVCEIIARSRVPAAIHVWNAQLEPLPGWPRDLAPTTGNPSRIMVVAKDMDLDGDHELAFMNDWSIEVWDFPGGGRIEWGDYAGDAQRTNSYHRGRPVWPRFLRGDVEADGVVTFVDAFRTLEYLSSQIELTCPARADFDGNGEVDLCDAIAQLQYSFLLGPTPMPPFPECETFAEDVDCALEPCP